ncbi:hypothetical protein BDB00DRAFT_934113 [Zychaea mexicana]|uniref:uncharacterized protein n=1 Tax=Zychaea mexicana TaxID=64656 RepID=UPI0022FE7A23|nr:uncharacterized protein BDB00DRAFT_934113 [Zychaea mexicana]KAI9477109.1 hypothetical protein BDB00DRAFT_934113 [Zychaea mexicana]
MREHGANQHHSFEMRRHTLQPAIPSSSSAAASASQGRRKSTPMTSGGGVDRRSRRRSSPHHYEERHQRRHQPTAVPLPPPQLSIAEQFMSSSSPSLSHNGTGSTDRTNIVATKKREETPRLSIAEQFMSQKERSATRQQEKEKEASNDDTNETAVENLASSIVRSTSAFSRLFASFHVGSSSSKVSDSRLSLELESVSTRSTSDARPVAKSDRHRRRHQQQHHHHHQQRSVRPHLQKHQQHQCHCQCSNNLYNNTTKYLDIEKSITQAVQEQDDKATNASRRKRKRRTVCVITTFAILMAGAITTFLTWPRTPLFRIDGASLLQSPSITETHFTNAGNVAFESAWSVTASIDNRQNYIPLHFTMETVVKSSGTVIGRHLQQQQQQEGQQVDLPARSISQVNIPVYIDYEARQASDPIFSSLRRACVEISHEALQLQFWITIHIAGLEWTSYNPSIVATPATGGLLCPTG